MYRVADLRRARLTPAMQGQIHKLYQNLKAELTRVHDRYLLEITFASFVAEITRTDEWGGKALEEVFNRREGNSAEPVLNVVVDIAIGKYGSHKNRSKTPMMEPALRDVSGRVVTAHFGRQKRGIQYWRNRMLKRFWPSQFGS